MKLSYITNQEPYGIFLTTIKLEDLKSIQTVITYPFI